MRADKDINRAWAEYLSVYDFDLFLTVKFPQNDYSMPRQEHQLRSVSDMGKYLAFVSSKVFGKKAIVDSNKSIKHITFFEDLTKRGNPTIFHSHSLLSVGQKNTDRTIHYLHKEWKKIHLWKNAAEPVIEKITDVYIASRYVTKYTNNDHQILHNLGY